MFSKRLILTLAISASLASGLIACSNDSTGPAKASFSADTLNADFSTIGFLFADSTMSGSDTIVQYGLGQYYGSQYVGWNQNTQSVSRFAQSLRSVLRYDLSALSVHAVIDSARLSLWQCGATGYAQGSGNLDPYTAGHIQVDHVQYPAVVASTADIFLADTLGPSLGAIATDSSAGFKSLSVTAAVAADYAAKRTTSEFRLDWIFDSAPASDTYNYYYAYLGGACGDSSPTGPSPFLIVWSH